MFFIFLGNSRLSAALSIGGSLLFLLNGNYGLELPRALQQTMHAAHSTFARMWPVIETASFALLVVTVLLLSGDWWVGEALGRGPILLADPQRTGTPRVDAPVLRTIPSCTFPDVDSPQKNVVLHRLERTPTESA